MGRSRSDARRSLYELANERFWARERRWITPEAEDQPDPSPPPDDPPDPPPGEGDPPELPPPPRRGP